MTIEVARKNPERPKTHHEEFMIGTGTVRLTEFFDLPRLRVKYGAVASTLIHSHDWQSSESSLAVRLAYTDSDDLDYVDFVDEDEILTIENALGYLSSSRHSLVHRARTYMEIVFKSRSGFRVGMYCGGANGDTGEFLDVAGETVFLHSLDDLRGLFGAARELATRVRQNRLV